MLDECMQDDIKYIHFTDEDFFFDIDRAYNILRHLDGKGMHLIALSSASAAWKFIDKYGSLILKDAGLEVMEIGFESAAESVSGKMGVGKSLSDCEKLARIQHELPFSIFWLVLTFFPGETITSLNETGNFLRKYGFEESEVVGRLRTNGTKGGLGQFFQPYHGLGLHKSLAQNGLFLTERPIRLIPSYVPNTFLDSRIKKINMNLADTATPWLELYNVKLTASDLTLGTSLRDYVIGKPMYQTIKTAIAFAIFARMGVIE